MRSFSPILGIVLAALCAVPALAYAHDGRAHLSRTPASLLERANADARLAYLEQLNAIAPAAVKGRCRATIDVPLQGPSCRLPGGMWGVKLDDGDTLSTHGPDYKASLSTLSDLAPTTEAALIEATDLGTYPNDSDYAACVTDATTPRYLAVYARPAGLVGDDPTQVALDMRASLRRASQFVNIEAREDQGGGPSAAATRLRLQCAAAQIDVRVVTLDVSGQQPFSALENAVRAKTGVADDNGITRLVVYYPVNYGGIAGQGGLYDDDRGATNNFNNRSDLLAFHYGDGGELNWEYFLHEMLHNMGAVQAGGKASTGPVATGGHCSSELDIMCYDDGGLASYPAPGAATCATTKLDCSGDTYFNAGTPGPGSWLANHWNAGSPSLNRYLDFGARNRDLVPPTVPANLSAVAASTSLVDVSWAPSSDLASAVSYQVEVEGFPTVGTTITAASSTTARVVSAAGSWSYIRVRALDASGNPSSWSSTLSFLNPDRGPLAAARNPRITRSAKSATIGWIDANTDRPSHSYAVIRVQPKFQLFSLPGTTTSHAERIAPGVVYRYLIRSRGESLKDVDVPIAFGTPVAPAKCTWSATDKAAPTKLGAARVTARTGKHVTIAWAKPRDARGVCAIRVYKKVGKKWVQAGPAIAATRTSATIRNVSSMPLQIEAFDGSGNLTKRVAVRPLRR